HQFGCSGDQYLLNTSEQTGTISTRERLDHKNHLYGLENFRISSKDNAAYQAFRMASAKLLNLE
ncbi:hypothetical protein, partial [Escherichia coli]|uniref:hypothetical protein n=1 Tax=Escherichia coli TaxID=562 RepID=UPI001D14A75F